LGDGLLSGASLVQFRKLLSIVFVLGALTACTTPDVLVSEPEQPQLTETRSALLDLPSPTRKLEVAVYQFEDATGQFKTADTFQTLSKAVSQGGASVLVKALQDAGNRSWFTVVERTNLTNLLQERKIIRDLRQRYLGEKTVNAKALPPMLFAGIILEGGVVGYDSNTVTGGLGARLLGIGGNAEYRHDTISVNLRAVSVKTGEVLASVLVQKSIISAGISASMFKYIDFDQVLELESGVTTNEPGLIALTKAIEKLVYTLIMEGVSSGLWEFEPGTDGADLVNQYLIEQGRNPITQKADNHVPTKQPATKQRRLVAAKTSAEPLKPKNAEVGPASAKKIIPGSAAKAKTIPSASQKEKVSPPPLLRDGAKGKSTEETKVAMAVRVKPADTGSASVVRRSAERDINPPASNGSTMRNEEFAPRE